VERQRYSGGNVISRHQAQAGLLALVTSAAAFLFFLSCSPVDPNCEQLLSHPDSDVSIPLPPNCELTANAPAHERTKYLEAERKRRGLIFKAWISCGQPGPGETREFAFAHDPHWLPGYEPGRYQFRQTVVISGDSSPGDRSGVAGVVCLMPRDRYTAQISGQCDGKFSIWK